MSRVRDPALLTCKEIVELVTDYQCRALDAADRARFEQHLFGCTWCMDYLKQMNRTISAVGALARAPSANEPAPEFGALFRAYRDKRDKGGKRE
jgi:hypothetical protein